MDHEDYKGSWVLIAITNYFIGSASDWKWNNNNTASSLRTYWYSHEPGLHFLLPLINQSWNNQIDRMFTDLLKSSFFASFSRGQAPSRIRLPQRALTIARSHFFRAVAYWGKKKFTKDETCSRKGKRPEQFRSSGVLLLIGAFGLFFGPLHTVMAAAASIGAKCSCCDMPTHEQLNSPTT